MAFGVGRIKVLLIFCLLIEICLHGVWLDVNVNVKVIVTVTGMLSRVDVAEVKRGWHGGQVSMADSPHREGASLHRH